MVPGTADIGTDYEIKAYRPGIGAVGEPGDTGYIPAQAERPAETVTHSVPGATITLSADEVQSGDTITVTGEGVAPFATVTVKLGTAQASGNADHAGDFSIDIGVPLFNPGNQLITIDAPPSLSETKLITIVAEPVVPATRTVAEEFDALIEAGVLDSVFRYNDDKSWSGYSPAAPAEANDLDTVNSGDILWVKVSADGESYAGRALTHGAQPLEPGRRPLRAGIPNQRR